MCYSVSEKWNHNWLFNSSPVATAVANDKWPSRHRCRKESALIGSLNFFKKVGPLYTECYSNTQFSLLDNLVIWMGVTFYTYTGVFTILSRSRKYLMKIFYAPYMGLPRTGISRPEMNCSCLRNLINQTQIFNVNKGLHYAIQGVVLSLPILSSAHIDQGAS